MTKARALHLFNAGARGRRSGGSTRAQTVAWCRDNKLNKAETACVLRGWAAERDLEKLGLRDGRRLGRP